MALQPEAIEAAAAQAQQAKLTPISLELQDLVDAYTTVNLNFIRGFALAHNVCRATEEIINLMRTPPKGEQQCVDLGEAFNKLFGEFANYEQYMVEHGEPEDDNPTTEQVAEPQAMPPSFETPVTVDSRPNH